MIKSILREIMQLTHYDDLLQDDTLGSIADYLPDKPDAFLEDSKDTGANF